MSVISALSVSQDLLRVKQVKVQTVINCKALYRRVIIMLLKIGYVFHIVCINLLYSHSEGAQRGLNLV